MHREGQLSIASTGKNPATGRLVTHEYRVAILTTTAADVDEEPGSEEDQNRKPV